MTQQVTSTIDRPVRTTPPRRRSTSRPNTPRAGSAPRLVRADRPLAATVTAAAHACRVRRPAPTLRTSARPGVAAEVRLTDRGIAVVLALGALLMLAAVLCVGVTAVRVTSEPAPQAAGVSAPVGGGTVAAAPGR
ncbi:hypothetical protein HJ590_07230 [Naumannella sp. ID2617S]|nr:hypothetical protein [Naumannella sp. ID2617S]